jgi:hypothetical protein
MKIAFTICSNNYLAQAKILADSIRYFQPEYTIFIILCDKKNYDINYTFFSQYTILEATELNIECFYDMCNKYTIVELNTSIKPFAFEYFYNNFQQADNIIYFDPDICIFSHLQAIETELADYPLLITPHIITPLEFDGLLPSENTFTQYGTFNLGSLATQRHNETFKLLAWWKRRMANNCFMNESKGIFVDQLPINLAIVFFKNIGISRNFGFNMAPWNLHERYLSEKDGQFYVNDTYPLIFYHFSQFKFGSYDLGAAKYSRPHQGNKEAFQKMLKWYESQLLVNNYTELSSIQCALSKSKPPSRKKSYWKKFKNALTRKGK